MTGRGYYHHALAWFRAFRRHDLTVPVWRLHRAIGMGGDHLVTEVARADAERAHGDELRAAWAKEFAPMLDEVRAFDGARELLTALAECGVRVVLASSGAPDHVEAYLELFGGREVAKAWTTSEDVDRTKPEPDLISVAVRRVGGGSALVIGDSVWDFVAAGRAGHAGYGVRSGGFSGAELRESGARAVFDSLPDLRAALPGTPGRG